MADPRTSITGSPTTSKCFLYFESQSIAFTNKIIVEYWYYISMS